MTRRGSSFAQFPTSAPSVSLGNSSQRIHSAQPRFDFAAASPNDDGLIRDVLSRSMRASSRSRAQIADNMSGLLGVRVTEKMLNAYSAESMNQYRLPAAWIRAFCCAADDPAVLHAIAQAGEFYLITAQEKSLLDLGRQYLRRKRANEEAELLEKRLAGLDL